jgi:ubiquinone/menaquinone biosynthesis C-methylase UbiE
MTAKGASLLLRAAELSRKAFLSTRTPMLLLDTSGTVVDINAACEVLLDLDAAGAKGRHFSILARRLKGKVTSSPFPEEGASTSHFGTADGSGLHEEIMLETAGLRVATSECRYNSGRLGPVTLRACELPCIDAASGACIGSSLSFEILAVHNWAAFRQAVDRRLEHEIMWDVYAASYDRVLPELPFYREVVERHCAALQEERVQTVVDLGAGTGAVALRLLKLGKSVTAVDIGRAMLARLHAKVDDAGAERLIVIEDTAESLPQLGDESFDGVNVLLAFFDMNHPQAAMGEALRLLRRGGKLIVTEPRACFNVNQLMAFAADSLRAQGLFERLAGDWTRIQTVAPLIRDRVQNPASPASRTGWHAEAILDHLRQKKFANLTFEESHLGNCATITGVKP